MNTWHRSARRAAAGLLCAALVIAIAPAAARADDAGVPADPVPPPSPALAPRVAAMALGPRGAAIRAQLASEDPAVLPASVRVSVLSPRFTLVEWNGIGPARNAWEEPRYAAVFFDGGHVAVARLEAYGSPPGSTGSDGDGAVALRVNGPITVAGDPARGVATVSVNGNATQYFRVRDGRVVTHDAEHAGSPHRVLCGVALSAPDGDWQLDPATLAEVSDRRCAAAFASIRDAVVEAQAPVVAARRGLDAVAPPADPAIGIGGLLRGATHACSRPDDAAQQLARTAIAALPASVASGRPPPASTRIDPSDFGCVDPRTHAFLVLAHGATPQDHNDAVIRVQRGRASLVGGWRAIPFAITDAADIDLNGDGAPETVMRLTSASIVEWVVVTGRGLVSLPARADGPAVRALFAPHGNGLLVDEAAGPMVLANGALVRASAGAFGSVRDALRTLARARADGTAVADTLDDVVRPPPGTPEERLLHRDEPARVAWERALVARMASLGVPADRARALVTAVPAAP